MSKPNNRLHKRRDRYPVLFSYSGHLNDHFLHAADPNIKNGVFQQLYDRGNACGMTMGTDGLEGHGRFLYKPSRQEVKGLLRRLAWVNQNNITVQLFNYGKPLGGASSERPSSRRQSVKASRSIAGILNEAAYGCREWPRLSRPLRGYTFDSPQPRT